MPTTRVTLVELDAALAEVLSLRLPPLGFEVSTIDAADAAKVLVETGPAAAVVNLELSRGSGFGLVNRLLRMEALAGLKIVLVSDKATAAALEAHQKGPTPAAAYVRRPDGSSPVAFADAVVDAVTRVLGEPLPEVDHGDLVEIVDRARTGKHEAPPSLEQIIAGIGPYRVLRRLRDEDGGAVFACRDEELGRAVAIKLLPPEDEGDDREERLQRFQREGRILALLQSPYVLSVYGAGTHRGIPYLVRELLDGESLSELVAREGALDVKTALERVRETALGLKHAAAAGVIHRDVRPHNIRVVDGHAKLARFAMGKRADDPRITRGGLQPLDMTWVAPERVRGHEDLRGDIYALGVVLHTLIAGRPPFSRPMPVDIVTGKLVERPAPLDEARPGTPPAVATVTARMMAEDPAARPQTWDEVLALLDEALRAGDASWQGDAGEPSAVHGTLRLMSVVEIAQGLELAKRSATVSLPTPEGEGKLAFDGGRLVHASFGALTGEDAFYALVKRKDGAFRVDYEPIALAANMDAPVTGLLLEAARRADAASAPPGPATTESSFFDFGSESPPTQSATGAVVAVADAGAGGDDDDDGARPPRLVPGALGFVGLVVGCALFVAGGFQLPPLFVDENADLADAAVGHAVAHMRDELLQQRAALAEVQPKLAAFEAAQASAASAGEAVKQAASEVQTSLAAALKPELDAGKLSLRLSDDGGEAVVAVGESALFSQGGDEVLPDGKTVLARIAGALATLGPVSIRVEGHTDDSEPHGRYRNNWGLSGGQAMAVAKVLTEQGVAAARVTAVGLADSVPLSPNHGARNRLRNRRLELHVSPSSPPSSSSSSQ